MWDPPTPPKNPSKKASNWGAANKRQPAMGKAKSNNAAPSRPGLHSKHNSDAPSGGAAAQGSKPSGRAGAAAAGGQDRRNYDKPWL